MKVSHYVSNVWREALDMQDFRSGYLGYCDFTWTEEQVIGFLNNLARGFPFGPILVWSLDAKDRIPICRIGPYTPQRVHFRHPVLLDGYHRLAVLSYLTSEDGDRPAAAGSQEARIWNDRTLHFDLLKKEFHFVAKGQVPAAGHVEGAALARSVAGLRASRSIEKSETQNKEALIEALDAAAQIFMQKMHAPVTEIYLTTPKDVSDLLKHGYAERNLSRIFRED